jgi:thiosulfate/3-mercaptopyruvate sulfurtransferase
MEVIVARDRFLIEAEELLTKYNDPNIRVYDATILFYIGLSPEEVAKMPSAHEQYLAGHIPNAAFFDHQAFSDADSPYEYMSAAQDVLVDQIGKIGISNDSVVILYATNILACATRAWWLLYAAGLKNVRVLNGGLAAWKIVDGAVEQGERKYPPAHFEGDFKTNLWASKEDVQAAINIDSVMIENSLTRDWYEQEHIPGSSCLPLTDLMIGWDAFIPDDQLTNRLNNFDPHQRIITYCGGGIAATVNAMAYLMAGHKNVAVYDGSLYEWKGESLPLRNNK